MMAQTQFQIREAEHTLCYTREASCFNDALPIGNGRIGAMVYGGIHEEKMSLNEDTLWSGYPKEIAQDNYQEIYQNAKISFENGERQHAQELLENHFGDFLVQMYLPLADIRIKFPNNQATHYQRKLHLDTGIHTTQYIINGKLFVREVFVSEPYQVMVMKIQCSKENSISFETEITARLSGCKFSTNSDVIMMHGTTPNSVAECGKSYRSLDSHIYDGKGIRYACALKVKTLGGTLTCENNCLRIENSNEAIIYFSVRTNYRGYNQLPFGEGYKEQCLKDIEKATAMDYESLKKESIASHSQLYNRCEVSLTTEYLKDRACSELSTEQRLMRHAKGEEDNALYTLLFNYGKYLTIAGSRQETQAMNLQGIWNDKVLPPWNSNYTLNINTQMNYWPTLTCGLFECYEPLIRMVEELAEKGKETAKLYYNQEGWVCHHSTDIWRLTHPGTNRIKNNAQWGFWNMASGWLSVMLWNYYQYTKDKNYLNKIYPIIEGAARFYVGLLVEHNGKLILPLSTSPENNYIKNGKKCAIDQSTAMTQEILFDLFVAVGEAASVLGVENEYSELAKRLQRPLIQENGALCEWHEEHEVWDIHHRHVSHLYGLFPSNQFMNDIDWKEACRKVLISRGDGGTGWSLAWKINLWARLGDGEQALQLLKKQLTPISSDYEERESGGGSYPNLFCAHPPFQIDGNFGATSGIIEMLVQCDKDGNVMLLPALPKSWSKGKVENLHLPGNRTLSFAWEEGKILWRTIDEKKK